MCDFPLAQYDLPHWKYVFGCCSKCPSIVNPKQELYITTQNMYPAIRFNVYKVFSHCIVHGRCTFEEKGSHVLYAIV